MTRISFAAALAVFTGLACSQPLGLGPAASPIPAGQVRAVDATVVFISLEGGCWALATANGHYGAINLPSPYQVDGLKVHAVLEGTSATIAICEPSPLVTVDSIRRR